jgi:hypothetical protein
LGIVEKVEQLAKSDEVIELIPSVENEPAERIRGASVDIFAQEPMDTSPSPAATPKHLDQRSAASTPSIGLLSESDASATPHDLSFDSRSRMLNVPVQVGDSREVSFK